MSDSDANGCYGCCGCLVIILILCFVTPLGGIVLGALDVFSENDSETIMGWVKTGGIWIGWGLLALFILGLIGMVMEKINGTEDKSEPTKEEKDQEKENEYYFFELIPNLISSLGKLTAIDGNVDQVEVNVVMNFIKGLECPDVIEMGLIKTYEQACRNHAPYNLYINALAECGDQSFLQMALAVHCTLAMSDGEICDKELSFLLYVEKQFGFPGYVRTYCKDFFYQQEQKASSLKASRDQMKTHYAILGCKPSNSDQEIKKAYRKKSLTFHPDKIESKGLPNEFKLFAEEEQKKVNIAYEEIMKYRNR